MKDLDVFIIAGQSNAMGNSAVSTLPEKMRYYYAPRVMLYEAGNFADYYSNRVIHGITCYMGHDPAQMGIEYGISQYFTRKKKNKEFGLIRFAWGGTNLYFHWKTDYNGDPQSTKEYGYCYHRFKQVVEAGLEAYKAEGYNPIIRGMAWMQGEDDTLKEDSANNYEENMKKLFDEFRKFLKVPDLKIVVGEIASMPPQSPFSNEVRASQKKVCDEDKRNIFLSTKDIPIGHDGWHFDGKEDFKLGMRFGKELLKLV